MLVSLTIKNYALIDYLNVSFTNGFTIITGETGAGKSILLGGLSLILGKRADLSSLKNKEQKCIIEAVFNIKDYNLKALFDSQDLDYETQTIIRREILPSGKSRAFINDSPVNLSTLQELAERLIDIHSQHQTLQLTKNDFQFEIIDALANNEKNLKTYSVLLHNFNSLKKELHSLLNLKADAIKELDYNTFLLHELVEANLTANELELLEEESEALGNTEIIKANLSEAFELLANEEIGGINTITSLKNTLQNIANVSVKYEKLYNRVNSSLIELDDIFGELDQLKDGVEENPRRLEVVNTRLALINNLLQKHQVGTVDELIIIQKELEIKVKDTENLDEAIAQQEQEIKLKQEQLDTSAKSISLKRTKAAPNLIKQLHSLLVDLGMPSSQFKIEITPSSKYYINGKDDLVFLFSANKGGSFNALKKAASGGELSRIMLAIKLVLSKYTKLPTIMFDEIDTGVSGEISNKMGDIMLQMSKNMQVFAITHLPQIAAKGNAHYKVYKKEVDNVTQTNLIKLNRETRIEEIAQMLGGTELSSSAIAHAKELLN